MKTWNLVVVGLLTSSLALAGPPQWTWDAGKQSNNGAITIKSMNGATTYAGTQNPTGAVVKMNQSASTQPPTVIVQATASLPIHAVGDACTQATSGVSPNQSADEGAAITADRQSLLSCQSGAWARQSGGGNGAPLYLVGYTGDADPAPCPPGWSQSSFERVVGGAAYNNRRTCVNQSGNCAVLYLTRATVDGDSSTCPTGWGEADYRRVNVANSFNNRRSCFKC